MSRPELHRGRLAKHPKVISVRALTPEDTLVLREKRVGPPRIQQFRETHHRVARLVAAGLRNPEIARLTGFTPARLQQYRNDPAFQQLVSEYKDKVNEAYVRSLDEFYESASELKLRAIQMAHDHFDKAEDDGDLIPLKTLGPIIADLADRTGHGKHSTQTNEIKDFAKMMKEMAAKSGRSNVIDAPPLAGSVPDGSDTQPESSFGGGFHRIEGRRG